jgi:hypothetical protein
MRTLLNPDDTATDTPPPERDAARERINALGRIYLQAGLPLAAAFEAALADYECMVESAAPCSL